MTMQKHCIFKANFNDFLALFLLFPPIFLCFYKVFSMIFWYLKIPSKPNGILGILSCRNHHAGTLYFQSKFQWFLALFLLFPPIFICFYKVFWMVFWYLKIPSKPNGILGILRNRNDHAETFVFLSLFQWFKALSLLFSLNFHLFLQGILNGFLVPQNTK